MTQDSMKKANSEGMKPIAELTPEEREKLHTLGTEVSIAADEVLIEEGSEGKDFFLLLSGRLAVNQGKKRIAELEEGDILGEMSLFNNDVRASQVVVIEPARLLRFETSVFWQLVLNNDPMAVKLTCLLGKTMMTRILTLDTKVNKLASKSDPSLARFIDSFNTLKKQMLSDWALKYHSIGLPGKLSITGTKPIGTAEDLSVAYSPGVAQPCLQIKERPEDAYVYTTKGHLVGVVSNGTAVLGLGDIGALASKPVMEGKAILFKRFAFLDAFDIEVDEKDPDKLIDIVCSIAPTFGGINLEDIRAPECFQIEQECIRRLDIPVFHDDQHGTAIIAGAAILNALEIIDKNIEDIRVVFSGAGAAGFSCSQYFLRLGVKRENLIMTDINGVVYKGRGDGNYLEEVAVETDKRTLAEVIEGSDIFVGLSAANILKPEMLKSMNRDPIVFAMANPNPEIEYSVALSTRSDVIIGTGRSDYPNQINNVIAFPYIFRGALDSNARMINSEMKIAATRAIAQLAKEDITGDVGFDGRGLKFGRNYVIPKPFDRRLLFYVASAVAEAAMNTGVAKKQLDLERYRMYLRELVRSYS
ncbi:malic enzyme-like NAD(P)-binding protein [Acidobacteriota bacterium]